MVLKGYCVRLQSSGEEEEKKSTGCHDDSPVLFDFEEDDEDEDAGEFTSLLRRMIRYETGEGKKRNRLYRNRPLPFLNKGEDGEEEIWCSDPQCYAWQCQHRVIDCGSN